MRSLTTTLERAAEHESLVFLCSFQKEESVIVDELLRVAPHVRVVTIDTGVLFPETLETWRAFEERCRRLASALAARGVRAGDTVAIVAPNIPAMLEAHYAVPALGAVLNSLN